MRRQEQVQSTEELRVIARGPVGAQAAESGRRRIAAGGQGPPQRRGWRRAGRLVGGSTGIEPDLRAT